MKILVVNDSLASTYARPFDHLGLEVTRDHDIIFNNPQDVGLVVFTGGEDVSPYLYGHKNYASYCSDYRDKQELAVYEEARAHNIPLAGICRGAQFLCVMAGGKLIQDCDRHTRRHEVVTADGERFEVTSSHHQMQYPWELVFGEDYEILAHSENPFSSYYLYNGRKILTSEASRHLKLEPDVVFYPGINALAAQFHPEWMSNDDDAMIWYRKTVSKYLKPLIEERDQKRTLTA